MSCICVNLPYRKSKMGFSPNTPNMGSPDIGPLIPVRFCLCVGLQPTSSYLGFRVLSSWYEFPIC